MGVTVGRWEMYVLRARTLVVGTRKPCGNAHSRRRPPPPPRGAFRKLKTVAKNREIHILCILGEYYSLVPRPVTNSIFEQIKQTVTGHKR